MLSCDLPCHECGEPEWSCDCGIPELKPEPEKRLGLAWVPVVVLLSVIPALVTMSYRAWSTQPTVSEVEADAYAGTDGMVSDLPNAHPKATVNRIGEDYGIVLQPEIAPLNWDTGPSIRYEKGKFKICNAAEDQCFVVDDDGLDQLELDGDTTPADR